MSNPVRQAILLLLSTKTEMAFTDIQRELDIGKMKLNFHLKNLFSSAMVDRYYRREFGDSRYSFYSLTPLGRRILDSLFQAFIPPSPIVDRISPETNFFEFTDVGMYSNTGNQMLCYLKKKTVCKIDSMPDGSPVVVEFKRNSSHEAYKISYEEENSLWPTL